MSQGTEAPTEHRLREARRKGDRPHSRDFTAACGMLAWTVAIVAGGALGFSVLVGYLEGVLRLAFDADGAPKASHWMPLHLLGAFAITGLLGILAFGLPELLQSRGEMATKRKLVDLSRIQPMAGLKKLFGLSRAAELLFAVVRLCVVGAIARVFLGGNLALPFVLQDRSWHVAWAIFAVQAGKVLAWSSIACLALAVLDLLVQHRLWIRRNRMKKDEIMREHKEQEGDPLVRGLRREAHRESTRG
ncbi:EscU/YscU/HrcU family type III secretion system export apparatus switch protein [Luteibacter sp. CQ10]|uniref:EscU/YscU/HrcU family type III secretion system export apparatus switch protein n=1 Tax=Luteibacter sp. CQ10 TaxID=2805821 RepID=UPI0034A31CE8